MFDDWKISIFFPSQLYKDVYSVSIYIIITIQIFSFSLSNYSLDDYQKESLVNRKYIASY